MLVDIDSVWNWYVDLDRLPMNFDVIHSVCSLNPGFARSLWHFTICAGLALYRPTENTLNLWDVYMTMMCNYCDDQTVLNAVYRYGSVSWFNSNDTRQDQMYYSPVGYFKLGVVPRLRETKRQRPDYVFPDDLKTPLQVMVVSKTDMKRGGTPEDCATSWLMNPWTSIPRGYPKNTPRAMRKILMFERFGNCTVRDNVTHVLL